MKYIRYVICCGTCNTLGFVYEKPNVKLKVRTMCYLCFKYIELGSHKNSKRPSS